MMTQANVPEVWQRGPIEGIPPLLQPVAHALLQASEEVEVIMKDFPAQGLWTKPAGMASVAFHLQHLSGVLDRLFTYAREEGLSPSQVEHLRQEGVEPDSVSNSKALVHLLLDRFRQQVNKCLDQLRHTDESTLTHTRYIGRARIPTTLIGLLFHAAEHTMRHLGQLLVTANVVRADTRA